MVSMTRLQRLNNDARRARVAAVARCAEQAEQHKQSSEKFELLRNDVAAKLPERRKRAETDTREAQAALEIEVEGRRAGQARLNNDARRARVAAVARCAEEIKQHKQSSEKFKLLRNYVAAELPERRKRAETDTREAQAALEIEGEGRRADQARAAGLEKQVSSSSTRSLFSSSSWLSELGRSFFYHSKAK